MKTSLLSRFSAGSLLLGLSLAAGLIISAAQITRAWVHIADAHVITVTGSAYQDVTSDDAIWTASFSDEADKLADAEQKLKADAARVQQFFQQHGITNAEISAITIQHLRRASDDAAGNDDNRRTAGYRLQQTVKFESADVPKVMTLQQQSSSLVDDGVELDDLGIQFIYTKIAEAKIDMLGAAAKDARARAEQIATQGGRKIRYLQSARMGVFQITPRNSNDISAEGVNDTTTREKTIRAIVTASFTMR
jgi:hypothetical protein